MTNTMLMAIVEGNTWTNIDLKLVLYALLVVHGKFCLLIT